MILYPWIRCHDAGETRCALVHTQRIVAVGECWLRDRRLRRPNPGFPASSHVTTRAAWKECVEAVVINHMA